MRRIVVTLTFALLAAGAWPALAQQGQSSIQGRVTDESGAALPGVVVVATNQASGMFRQVVSNPDGSYFMTGVLPGTYRVTAELPGFQRFDRKEVLLQIGTTTTLDIAMELGGVQENITVTGSAPLVDVTSKQVGANITQEELAALPILNKNWMFAVSLAPGVQIQSSTASFACESLIVGGGSNRSGNFAVDGGGNNDDYLGSSCGSQVRTALEAVQEFQVLTNQYDAEFGRTAGAVINAITKQGTNSFHGALFGSYTDDRVTAPDFFVAQNNLRKPQTAQKNWGGTLGGPLVRNRAHFFYSLDRIVYDEGRSNTFTARPELNYSNTQSMKLWNHLIRFDHQINAGNTWSVRFMEEDSPTYDRIAGRRTLAAKDQEYDVDRSAGGHWNTIFGNTRFNTVRAGYTFEKNGFTAAEVQNGVPMTDLPPTLTMLTFLDGTAPGALFRINKAYEVSETFTQFVPEWAGGDHDIKVGAQYIYSNIHLPDQTDMNGRFSFATDRGFNAADPSTYPERLFIRVPAPSDIRMPTHVGVLFAQDKWHRGNLTLNVGVRYDLEVTPIDNSANPLFGPDEHAVDKNNIAARTGFAWQPGGKGTSLIRGGYGLFYDKITLVTTTPFVSQGIYSPSFTAAFPNDRADPGPSTGRLPIDPLLANGPVINRALINALYPPGSVGRNTGVVFVDNPDRVVPKVHQVTLGFQRQLGAQMALTVDYVRSWNRDQLINFDLNPARRVNTTRTGALVYTDLNNLAQRLGVSAFANQVLTRVNDGSSEFDGMNVQLEKRYSHHWAARVSYSMGYARGNAEANQTANNDYQLLGDPRLDRNVGALDNDRRQNFVLSGRVEIPRTGGLTLSGVYRWMTGTPMTLYNSNVDADQNGRLFDPIPAGRYCGVGNNAFCTENDGGRNGARGPSYTQMDMRFGYRLRPRGRTFDVNFELFNILNTANFSNPTADMRLTDFLVLTALRGGNGQPRAAQLGIRFGF
ncbi:MAG: carboxypeptidase regulatory-like domain-containing protein [Acidobacteriota bacterium]|nr:carboxypeptidase regulatory-like domain-containing protein [Acidobacteriota bacterium]